MNMSRNDSLIGKRRLDKLEKKFYSMNVTIPKEVSDWEKSLTMQELYACGGYSMIPDDERPPDMLNPHDVVDHRLPDAAFKWARKHIKQARAIEKEIKDYSKMATWVLHVLTIYEFWERKQAGDVDSLPEGAEPLHISQFVEGEPYQLPGSYREYFKPARIYRKKPKK